MSRSVFHSKAVMGGGKSFSAIDHLCNQLGNQIVYAVPTKRLAGQIAEDIENTEHSIYEFDFESGGEPLDEDGNRLLTDRRVRVITADESDSVVADFRDQLGKSNFDVVVITHQCLFEFALQGNLSGLGNWVLFIDEDPQPFRVHGTSDVSHQVEEFNNLISSLSVPSDEVSEFSLDDKQRARLSELFAVRHGLGVNNSVKDMLLLLGSEREYKAYVKESNEKSFWFVLEFMPLVSIVDAALQTHILSSQLSALTQLYFKHVGIDVRMSPICARNKVFPESLQRKVNIHRVWSEGNHSVSRIKSYGDVALRDVIAGFLGGRDFISRTNDGYRDLFKATQGHVERLSKVSVGLNAFKGQSVIVDLAAYNQPLDIDAFYSELDSYFDLEAGFIKKAVEEVENLEPSAQAVCRLGLREMHDAKHDEYVIVVPDRRTEGYLREVYFPEANYLGAVVTDEVRASLGRRAGGQNSTTQKSVDEVKRLIKAGMSQNKACLEVGIGKPTFIKYR